MTGSFINVFSISGSSDEVDEVRQKKEVQKHRRSILKSETRDVPATVRDETGGELCDTCLLPTTNTDSCIEHIHIAGPKDGINSKCVQ